jgi:hypothetical protein
MYKYFYTDDEIQECPPETSAPVFPVPSENAPNSVVKKYLLDVLTRTGWGIAIESNREVRATVNKFVGNGWVLRNKFQKKGLKYICPTQMSVRGKNGAVQIFKISDSTRSNIADCVMHEMERYFQEEKKIQDSEGNRGHGDANLVVQPKDGDTNSGDSSDGVSESGQVQLARPSHNRATLPDEWLTERIRAQQA